MERTSVMSRIGSESESETKSQYGCSDNCSSEREIVLNLQIIESPHDVEKWILVQKRIKKTTRLIVDHVEELKRQEEYKEITEYDEYDEYDGPDGRKSRTTQDK